VRCSGGSATVIPDPNTGGRDGATEARSNDASRIVSVRNVDMRLEVVVIPVSDVDRAKQFYGSLGWRLDADVATGDDFRLIQFTPPGSVSR
jgi:hypothetical protein